MMSGSISGPARIALTYFSALPVMRWTNGAALVLLLTGLVVRFVSSQRAGFEASAALMMFGGVLILLPWMLGGGMMRAASTRAILHQRPRGRQRMLLGTTLAITLMAIFVTLLLLILNPDGIPGVRPPPWADIRPLSLFAIAWTLIAMTWAAMFIASGNLILSVLVSFVPLAMVKFGRAIAGSVPDAPVMFALGLIVWAAFSLWYLRAPEIRRLVYGRSQLANAQDNPGNRFFQWASGTHRQPSRAHATDQYLLGMAPQGHLVVGVILLLVSAVIHLVLGRLVFGSSADLAALRPVAPLFLAPVILIVSAVLSFALTRRARILWLRSGLDRIALFRQAERTGIIGAMLSFGPFMLGAILYAMAIWPPHVDAILVFLVAQIAFLVCLFYAGLSLTRGWSALDTLLCIGLPLLFAGEVLLLQPWSSQPYTPAPLVVSALLALALLLRWHARRRWLVLDWRVARLTQLPQRG